VCGEVKLNLNMFHTLLFNIRIYFLINNNAYYILHVCMFKIMSVCCMYVHYTATEQF